MFKNRLKSFKAKIKQHQRLTLGKKPFRIITVLLTRVRNENIEMLGGVRKGNKVVYKKFFLTRQNQYRSVCTLLAAG